MHVDHVRGNNGWKPLDSLAIVVPPPPGGQGYGLMATEANNFVTTSEAEAKKAVSDFETGKIKSIDDPMAKLNVTLARDASGTGAKLIPNAKVVLVRSGANWTSKTHFPTNDPVGWDITGRTAGDGVSAGTPAPACTF